MRVERTDYEEVADKLVVRSRLCDGYGGHRGEAFQVLTFRDGRIVGIRACRTHREAVRLARAHG